jgi:hypothetical protein
MERFAILIKEQEPFDYTKWRQNLFEGMTIQEISGMAMESYNEHLAKKGRLD